MTEEIISINYCTRRVRKCICFWMIDNNLNLLRVTNAAEPTLGHGRDGHHMHEGPDDLDEHFSNLDLCATHV